MSVDLNDPVMASYFVDAHDGKWGVKGTNIQIWGDIRNFYCKYGGVALFGLPLTSERTDIVPGRPVTVCERGIIIFDPNREYDNPPVEGTCYLIHLTSGKGQEYLARPVIASLSAELTASQAKVKELEEKLAQQPGSDYEQIKQQLSEALQTVARYKQTVDTYVSAQTALSAL